MNSGLTKICRICDLVLDLSMFQKARTNDGLKNDCKKCCSISDKRYKAIKRGDLETVKMCDNLLKNKYTLDFGNGKMNELTITSASGRLITLNIDTPINHNQYLEIFDFIGNKAGKQTPYHGVSTTNKSTNAKNHFTASIFNRSINTTKKMPIVYYATANEAALAYNKVAPKFGLPLNNILDVFPFNYPNHFYSDDKKVGRKKIDVSRDRAIELTELAIDKCKNNEDIEFINKCKGVINGHEFTHVFKSDLDIFKSVINQTLYRTIKHHSSHADELINDSFSLGVNKATSYINRGMIQAKDNPKRCLRSVFYYASKTIQSNFYKKFSEDRVLVVFNERLM